MEKSIKRGSKIWQTIDKILSVWSTAIMALMCVMVIVSVLLRYVFNIAYTWSEELIVFLFIYTTYFGSILCVKEKEHIDIPFLRECASDKVGFIMDIFVCLANTAIQASLAIVSFGWIEKTGSSLTAGLKILYLLPVPDMLFYNGNLHNKKINQFNCIKRRNQKERR